MQTTGCFECTYLHAVLCLDGQEVQARIFVGGQQRAQSLREHRLLVQEEERLPVRVRLPQQRYVPVNTERR
jgi:hypothetical protein